MKKQNGELVCVLANQIAEARHKLTVQEQRLVLWLIAQIEPDDSDFLTHRLAVKDFEAVTGSTSGRLYEQMKDVSTGLLQRVLEIRQPGQRSGVRFQWFSCVEYNDGQGALTVRFHELLKPFLLELKARFTQLSLARVLKLRGGYSIRFYELLSSRQNLRRFSMSIDELRHWAGLDAGELPAVADLRRFVIEQARRELDAKADLTFEYQPQKQGRQWVGFDFTIRRNKPKSARKVVEQPPAESEETRHQVKASLAEFRKKMTGQQNTVDV